MSEKNHKLFRSYAKTANASINKIKAKFKRSNRSSKAKALTFMLVSVGPKEGKPTQKIDFTEFLKP